MSAPARAGRLAGVSRDGWPALFASAFHQSRNAMVLVDADRQIVDVNPAFARLLGRPRPALIRHRIFEFLADGPLATPREWHETIARRRFAGDAVLVAADGGRVAVQWGASTEVVTGHRLVLFVTLNSSSWGGRLRPVKDPDPRSPALSPREREVVRRVALGEAGPEIAAELGIANETVRTHVRNAMAKLGARSRAQLVAKALGGGLLDAD
jgi:PAS domain S-box-containing protein